MAGSKCDRVRFGDGKMRGEFSEENAKRNVCVRLFWREQGGVDWRVRVVRDGIEEGLNGH